MLTSPPLDPNKDFGGDAEVTALIYEMAVRRANQTIVYSDESNQRRRIPRDIRRASLPSM